MSAFVSPQSINLDIRGFAIVWAGCTLALTSLLGIRYMGSRQGRTSYAFTQQALRGGWTRSRGAYYDPAGAMVRSLFSVSIFLGLGLAWAVTFVLSHPALWVPAAAAAVAAWWF